MEIFLKKKEEEKNRCVMTKNFIIYNTFNIELRQHPLKANGLPTSISSESFSTLSSAATSNMKYD